MDIYRDREDAGRQLACKLAGRTSGDVVVLGLPRGGVPVAACVARALDAPLDVIVVRKLGVPGHREYAMGAIGERGARHVDPDVVASLGITEDQIAGVEAAERDELVRRVRRYRGGRPIGSLDGRVAVLVDDGMATGSTAMAACRVARLLGAREVVVAVPVASMSALESVRAVADRVVALQVPVAFRSVGEWYDEFGDTSDDEVVGALRRHASHDDASPTSGIGSDGLTLLPSVT